MNMAAMLQPATARKRVTILGSTGTIGCNAVDLLQRAGETYEVVAITGGHNIELLAQQARLLRPQLVVTAYEADYAALQQALSGSGIMVGCGEPGLLEAARLQTDIVLSAIVGVAGLKPTLEAISQGRVVALANKECLVSAGPLMLRTSVASGATLLPVDSEHCALYQLLEGRPRDGLSRLTITASGGPFRDWTHEQMRTATPQQAINHPNWRMGAKISVDSATMMNKGLEWLEAHALFSIPGEQIEILVHPESVVHALAHYHDGSVLAQMSLPDMRIPISYALAWPQRMALDLPPLNLAAIGKLQFFEVDEDRFPAPALARQALEMGGIFPAVLNAANETAVARFLNQEIGFLDIIACVRATMEHMNAANSTSLDDILSATELAQTYANEWTA